MSDLLNPFDSVIQLCVDVKPTVHQGINLMGVMTRCLTSFFFLALLLSSFSLSRVSHLAATNTLAARYTHSTLLLISNY